MTKALVHTHVPEPVLLVIADISGYTRYMTANAKTLAHSQTIITELVKAIVAAVHLPLEVAKLEGDAVFLFCRKEQGPRAWRELKQAVGDKLLAFFGLFADRLFELSQSSTCSCHACTHIGDLRLKIIVHSGEALFHRVFNFVELAGVDVILVHRLLKNSVQGDEYLLLTESAANDLELGDAMDVSEGAETYPEIGCVRTRVYLPRRSTAVQAVSAGPFQERFARSARLAWKLWFSPFAHRQRPNHITTNHITTNATPLGRFAWAVLTLILTPIYLPVLLVSLLFRRK
jgi:hypothetical protein